MMNKSALILMTLLAPACLEARDWDLILHGGKVVTATGSIVEAVGVLGDRVAAAGADADILARQGPRTRLVNLRGRTVTPGFHDAHVHFLKGALSLLQVDVNNTTTTAVIQDRVRQYARSEPGAPWIIGRGWDRTALPGQRYPPRQDLDAVSTRPIVLTDVDGHCYWVNSEVLRRARITRDTPDPKGGRLLRDESGEPTGIFLEKAMDLVEPHIPQPDLALKKLAVRKALALARQSGVTAVESMQGPVDFPLSEQIDLLKDAQKEGSLTLRFFAWGNLEDPKGFAALKAGYSDLPQDRLALVGLKGFVDGVIGARTAALLEPYSDDPQTKGAALHTPGELAALVQDSLRRGWPVALHAIGDAAVRMALDACQAVPEPSARISYPCRVEHIEVVDPADVPRFGLLRVAASMQPSHMTYDMESQNYNPGRLGARVRHAFAWRSLSQAGALLAFGTDWPVMPLNPQVNLFAATTRQHFNGRPAGGWIPEEKLSLEETIRHYTRDSAALLGMEKDLGTIEPGRKADLVVFDRDLFSALGPELLESRVDMTVFDGKIVYERLPGAR